MAEEKQHHHFFHRHKEGDVVVEETIDYKKQLKHHKQKQHLGEIGALAAGAYALHEKHKAKKDPENAHRHRIKEEVAAVVAVGAGGFALHEHHKKKEVKNVLKGERHHHF